MNKNIVRVNKTKNYTVMSNTHLRDTRLSWKAKGIHSYVLSLPDDWRIILSHLETISIDGEKSLRSGLKELYDLKYWQKYPVYVDGKVMQWVTEIYEEPFPENEKIKSIVVKNNQKTINYENDNTQVEIIDYDLLPPKGKVDEGKEITGIDLLPQKVQVGNVEVGKVEVDKDGLLNTNITNDLSFSNNSFNQSQKLSTEIKENERLSENSTVNEFNQILKNSSYDDIEKEYIPAVEQAIRILYYTDKPLAINGTRVPPHQVREDLNRLRWEHIDLALRDFTIASERQQINNVTAYLSRCIYNAIFNSSLKVEADLRYNGLI